MAQNKVWATDTASGMPDVLLDPLLAEPPVLQSGVALPGDHAPQQCLEKTLPTPMSLGEAVDIALCNDPRVQVAWASIKLQTATVGEARAAYLPTVNASISRLNDEVRYPSFPNANSRVTGTSSSATLNWRIFDFGERAANRLAANNMLDAALASYDAALQKTLETTIQAYFDALTAQAVYRARVQSENLAADTYEAAKRREVRGATGRSDTLQAQTALARARLTEQRAANDADKAMAVLAYALGTPANTSFMLPQDAPESVKQTFAELSSWLDMAKRYHPAIIAAQKQWQATKSKIDSARSQGMPTVDFGVSFYQNGFPNQGIQSTRSNTTIIGVTLNIPLFEGFSRTYRVREAQAQADQDKARIQDAEREVLSTVVKAYADATSSLKELVSSRQLLDSAELALTSARRRYDHGVADILEVLNAQSALADAQQERAHCESDWRSARLRLRAATGLLGRRRIAGLESQ